jgi:hypothetical protein
MMMNPSLSQRVSLYLKPIGGSSSTCKLLFLLLDTAFTWIFVGCAINYIFTEKFKEGTDKTMLLLIGPCFTCTFLIFVIVDAIRYLPKWSDKFLYALSCALQKPILLPVLMSGSFFRSYEAVRGKSGKVMPVRGSFSGTLETLDVQNEDCFEVNGIHETQFMLAV